MSFLFGTRKTPEEQLRDSKRTIARTLREIDREKTQLERERVRITNEIRALAKRGQIDAVKVMAKQLVRTESYIKKFSLMHSNITVCHVLSVEYFLIIGVINENSDFKINRHDGFSYETGCANDEKNEFNYAITSIPKDYDGVRKTNRNDGNETRYDVRCNR